MEMDSNANVMGLGNVDTPGENNEPQDKHGGEGYGVEDSQMRAQQPEGQPISGPPQQQSPQPPPPPPSFHLPLHFEEQPQVAANQATFAQPPSPYSPAAGAQQPATERFDWGEALRDASYLDRYIERRMGAIKSQMEEIARRTAAAKVELQMSTASQVLQSFTLQNEELLRQPAVADEFQKSLSEVARIALSEGDASPLLNEEFYYGLLGMALAKALKSGKITGRPSRSGQQSIAGPGAATFSTSVGSGSYQPPQGLTREEDALRREWGLSIEEWEANKLGISVDEYRRRGGRNA